MSSEHPNPSEDREQQPVEASPAPRASAAPAIHHSPALQKYWRRNILVMSILLGIWALAGLGCGILFADFLNQFRLFNTGYPLGFWFAQQGSIIVFVVVILAYCLIMNRLDAIHKKEREEEERGRTAERVEETAPGSGTQEDPSTEGGAA